MVSRKYTQHWQATNEWLAGHAPRWVTDFIGDGVGVFRKLVNQWMYIGLINEAALYMIRMQCDEAFFQTARIKQIRILVNAADKASKKIFDLADEDTVPSPHAAIGLLMREMYSEEFVQNIEQKVQDRTSA
jgi:hypothetical protein